MGDARRAWMRWSVLYRLSRAFGIGRARAFVVAFEATLPILRGEERA